MSGTISPAAPALGSAAADFVGKPGCDPAARRVGGLVVLSSRLAERRWAREEAIPQIESLLQARRPLEALAILQRAEKDLPGDAHLRQLSDANTKLVDVTSQPEGAQVSIQDYMTPEGPALQLGYDSAEERADPPRIFSLDRREARESGKMVVAPETAQSMNFPLALAQKAPPGNGLRDRGIVGRFQRIHRVDGAI